MKTLVNAILIFAFVGVSAAVDLPDEPPDDFFMAFDAFDFNVPASAADVYSFRFTASASGSATLKVAGSKKVTFDIDGKSVEKLYNAVRGLWETMGPIPKGIVWTRKIHVIADGNEASFLVNNEVIEPSKPLLKFEKAVLDVLDEERPGWRD
ncbi:MAG: hypothetical protein JSW52_10645 [Candidatus Coatesbacteria bacterium]|nr:MAG: hypothetical protein JSW52_10645 [Candidatus Coatesbacteria bacterium]